MMDYSGHPSLYVAPLQFGKDATIVNQDSSSRTQTPSATHHSTGQMTPPLTPSDIEPRGDFQSYLRAIYPYYPSYEQGSTITLPLNRGEVILVHSIHINGWADGTLLSSGVRGWFPTNYCEGYHNEPTSTLLKALTILWDLVRGARDGNYSLFLNSEYNRGLVAGVRCLLDRTQCLSRDCPIVQSNAAVRKNRRALLSDLSAFVKATKNVEASLNNESTDNVRAEIDMDELITKATKTVIRAVRFYDAWEEHMQTIAASSNYATVPPTPPADQAEFSIGDCAYDYDTGSRNGALANINSARDNQQPDCHRPRYSRASQTYVRPGSRSSCGQTTRPLSTQGSGHVAHRVSCVVHTRSQNLASERLASLHNVFLTCLGYFIGIHIQSRSSSELLLTTKQSVLACRDMLDLVSEIWERDGKRSYALGEARDDMYRKVAELAEAARFMFRGSQPDEEDVVIPSEGQSLMDAATACVRTAGECAAECRLIIERIGDFDFSEGASNPEPERNHGASPTTEDHHMVDEEENVGTNQVPSPPQSFQEASPQLPEPTQRHKSTASLTLAVPPRSDSRMDVDPVKRDSWRISTEEMLLPPLPQFTPNLLVQEEQLPSPQTSFGSTVESSASDGWQTRKNSINVSNASDSSGYLSSVRDSEASALSQTSTRATSPDATFNSSNRNQSFTTSFAGGQRLCEVDEDFEANLLERTFAHELVYNKDGQITGGTLPALIERLTTPDSTPDATFVSTFFLTFRLFATPLEFAQALIDRYNYVGESPRISGPVRLRVYNVFKGWLESHWRNDCDKSALELINSFANRQLQIVLPTAGKRLASLTEQVTAVNGPLVPRLISSIGKTNTSIAQYIAPDAPMPASVISKSQMNALKNWKLGGSNISILDFDPVEIARQLTIKESQIFCSILPEELLASEWSKSSGSMAVNVRSMSRLSTDIANLVAENILQADDAKKRAVIIKQWTKIAEKLYEISNYHSLMAIVCSLMQSTIMRLKRTWELVSEKTKKRLDRLKDVINHERNHASLRQKFQDQTPPCIPWVGLYLTDLTFVDAGNHTTRQLPGLGSESGKSVINFDKHMKTAKIISELQRFQVPYRFQEVAELQTWMQDQLVRVRTLDQTAVVKDYYRRSLLLEPRAAPETQTSSFGREKFEHFFLGIKDRNASVITNTPT